MVKTIQEAKIWAEGMKAGLCFVGDYFCIERVWGCIQEYIPEEWQIEAFECIEYGYTIVDGEPKEIEEETEEEEEEETWQEKMKKYDNLVSACLPFSYTKDEDLVVGDIVKHSFGCRNYKLMRVSKLTEKTIWYEECFTGTISFRDTTGDFHTYGKYLSDGFVMNGLKYKRKRHTKVLDSYYDEKWRGQRVYKYGGIYGNIWIKEEETDIMR